MRRSLYKNLLPETNSETTKELRYFLDNGAVLFDPNDKYPIWNEDHRTELEKKIVDHYAMWQIGFETFGRFKHEVNTRMREIMPYYIDIWKTTQYEYNPIENYSMTEEFNDNISAEERNLLKALETNHDTPQSEISALDKYMSGATKHDNQGETNTKHDTKHSGWRKGNIGVTTTQQMIEQERKATLNLDVMIIDELKDLFLGVF